jgi:hypothetical protein
LILKQSRINLNLFAECCVNKAITYENQNTATCSASNHQRNRNPTQSELVQMKKIDQIAALQRALFNLRAQDIGAYKTANEQLRALAKKSLMGSGVIVQILYLDGKEALSPVMISDGLCKDSIRFLCDNVVRSHELRIGINYINKQVIA